MMKLTKTEMRIAEMISAQGLTNAEVAEIIGVGKRTVDTHLRNIYIKLKIRNRAELIIKMLEGDRKMKKLELIENVIELATNGEGLHESGQSCRYKIDYLSNKDLHTLLDSKYKEYEVEHDRYNNDYINITKI